MLVDGNQICSPGVERIEAILSGAGKELGSKSIVMSSFLLLRFLTHISLTVELDDNDEDGEDDLEEVEDVASEGETQETGLETDMSSLNVT